LLFSRYLAYKWINGTGKQARAISILGSGIEANPTSFVLNYAYIEYLESKQNYEQVHIAFEKFLGVLRKNLETIRAQPASSTNVQCIDDDDLEERKKEYGVAWVNYMKFGRRAEGMSSFRAIFAKARQERHVSWIVFEAAGMSTSDEPSRYK